MNMSRSRLGADFQVYNRNPDTILAYTMNINRDDSHTQRDASN